MIGPEGEVFTAKAELSKVNYITIILRLNRIFLLEL